MTTYWFRPKRYGYGATPVTWQGWVVTLVGAIAVAAAFIVPILPGGRPWAPVAIGCGVIAIIALVIVTRLKTEGGWGWRWGG